MGDKLRKEHEELKIQLRNFMKAKMTEKLDRSLAPTREDVQLLNFSCDELLAWKHDAMAEMASFKGKLDSLAEKVEEIKL